MNELKGVDLILAEYHTSFIDVPGHIALSIYTAGCNRPCKAQCHNPSLHNFDRAIIKSKDIMLGIENKLLNEKGFLTAVAIMGGEPLMQDNSKLLDYITYLKDMGFYVCLYTSYELNEVPQKILDKIDAVKTGQYDKELATPDMFPASSNQVYYTKELNQEGLYDLELGWEIYTPEKSTDILRRVLND